MHIEKSFWLSWPWFSYSILGNFGFRKYFITLIEILLKDQLLCAMHGGTSTQNFNLEREACQCDPISTYLFILTLHILFLIKKTPWKRQRNIRALFLLYCLCRQSEIFSERFTIHFIPSWNIQYFSLFFRIETKFNKMQNSRNRSPKRGSIGNLWYGIHWST